MPRKFPTVDLRKVVEVQIADSALRQAIIDNLNALGPDGYAGPGTCKKWCTQGTTTVCCDPPTTGQGIISNRLLIEKVVEVNATKEDGTSADKRTIFPENMTDFKVVAFSKEATNVQVTIPGKQPFNLSLSFRLES